MATIPTIALGNLSGYFGDMHTLVNKFEQPQPHPWVLADTLDANRVVYNLYLDISGAVRQDVEAARGCNIVCIHFVQTGISSYTPVFMGSNGNRVMGGWVGSTVVDAINGILPSMAQRDESRGY